MEDTRPPEEFVSSHPPASRARAWRPTALALALLLVLASGAWVLWRPLSDDDAARLTARATVESVRTGLHPDPRWLPDDVLARQLDALAPAATPAQQRRLDERGVDVGRPTSLDAAADELARLARETEDPELTSELASVAASWWAGAADGRGAGAHAPGGVADGAGAQGTAANRDGACGEEISAAVSAVDRSLFVAEAAAARSTSHADSTVSALSEAAQLHRTALTDSRVAAALVCDPPPVAGFHELPAGFTDDPARATGAAEQEARDALVRAAASSSGEQRAWTLDALRTAARAGQVLDPEQPVPALPGRA